MKYNNVTVTAGFHKWEIILFDHKCKTHGDTLYLGLAMDQKELAYAGCFRCTYNNVHGNNDVSEKDLKEEAIKVSDEILASFMEDIKQREAQHMAKAGKLN